MAANTLQVPTLEPTVESLHSVVGVITRWAKDKDPLIRRMEIGSQYSPYIRRTGDAMSGSLEIKHADGIVIRSHRGTDENVNLIRTGLDRETILSYNKGEDAFSLNKGLRVTVGDIHITNGTEHIMHRYGQVPVYRTNHANGNDTSPAKTASGDRIGLFGSAGYQETTGTFTGLSGALIFGADEDFTSAARGTHFRIETTAVGSLMRTERLRIDPAGNVKIASLAGSGARTVVADANGVLSAP